VVSDRGYRWPAANKAVSGLSRKQDYVLSVNAFETSLLFCRLDHREEVGRQFLVANGDPVTIRPVACRLLEDAATLVHLLVEFRTAVVPQFLVVATRDRGLDAAGVMPASPNSMPGPQSFVVIQGNQPPPQPTIYRSIRRLTRELSDRT